MSPQDYFYWLQGFFELTDNFEVPKGEGLCEERRRLVRRTLTGWQVKCVIKHDDLVAAHGTRNEAMIKIRTVLDMMNEQSIDLRVGTAKIRAIVAHTFEHVIDPAAGGSEVQKKLDAIHGKSGVVYRC